MPRDAFEQEMLRLQNEMLTMAETVESALSDSVESLKQRDLDWSKRLIDQDRLINQKRFSIEAECLIVVATQQPMATDLRIIAAILFNVNELERIGDYAKGIAKINLMIGPGPLLKPLIDVPRMAEKARSMLHRAVKAFIARDVAAARQIPAEDDEVDALFEQVNRELLTYIMADPRIISQANLLLWVAHNLERAADRVTNLCERTVFAVTGELFEFDTDSVQELE
ncbi:MAG: phosphate signaling complex protein PhoU [Rudaea sp.]